jgi:gliding motility-associated-like protein
MAAGINTFTWSIEDPGGFCLEVDTLVIAVNNPITAADNQQSVSVGGTTVIDLLTGAVINAGDVITASIITDATQGTTSIQGTDLTYVSSTSGTGVDVIEFEICNQCGSCSRAQLSITIENLPPETSFNQNIQVTNANFSFDLLAGITDPNNNLDPQSLAVIQQPASGATAQIQNGILVLNYTGVRFSGTDIVVLQVCDLSGACTQFTLSFEVNTEDPQIVVYNAVTPNGDGRHDFLEIDNISFYENNVVRVFNRWGEEVDRIEGYDNSTNVFTGDRLPAGTYYYLISLTGNKEDASGSLLLKKAK